MAYLSIEKCLERAGSIYKLVLLASERAKEVAEGAKPLIPAGEMKVTSLALEEIVRGKVRYKVEPEGGPKKKK